MSESRDVKTFSIIKRTGQEQLFNGEKIKNAIIKANNAIDPLYKISDNEIEAITDSVIDEIRECSRQFNVEEIQDLVENGLMSCRRKDVASSYIHYRYERQRVREHNTTFMKEVARKLDASDVQNQNANVDEHSFGGRMGEANRALTKKFALDYCMSEMSRYNHLNNLIV